MRVAIERDIGDLLYIRMIMDSMNISALPEAQIGQGLIVTRWKRFFLFAIYSTSFTYSINRVENT